MAGKGLKAVLIAVPVVALLGGGALTTMLHSRIHYTIVKLQFNVKRRSLRLKSWQV